MTRPLQAHIDLHALQYNAQIAKTTHGDHVMAVIKANAYGHGAVQCAQALLGIVDGFAVASLAEASELREAGISEPILLLEGFFVAAELEQIVKNDCWVVVHAQWQLDILLTANLIQPLSIWLKVDTGMHRLGVQPAAVENIVQQLYQSENVDNLTLMTHFANADNVISGDTVDQLAIFSNVMQAIQANQNRPILFDASLENSAAILAWQISCEAACEPLQSLLSRTWCRPGLMLYGASPLTDINIETGLKPVMTLTSKIIAVQTVKAGQSAGYGSLFTPTRDARIGVVACGYADGYPRSAKDAPVLVSGEKTQVVGRVSMDMLFVDITDIPAASVGSEVELWGQHIAINAVAHSAGTLAYELMCNVKRAEFFYHN